MGQIRNTVRPLNVEDVLNQHHMMNLIQNIFFTLRLRNETSYPRTSNLFPHLETNNMRELIRKIS